MFPALAAFAAILGASVIATDSGSYIRLEASNRTIEAGERFSLAVYANAHVPVNAVDIALSFDNKAVKVLEVDRGQSVLTIWTEDPIIKSNEVTLSGGTFRKGFIGEHLIATIDLEALNTGQGSFAASNVMFLAGDGSGTAVSITQTQDATVNFFVYDENTDPSEIALNAQVKIVSDINGDGVVTLADISAFMAAWSSKDQFYDFNNDGRMTIRDFSIILADYFLQ